MAETAVQFVPTAPKWRGDSLFVIQEFILKDFKVRYRNMSLGVFWSLLNPLVMMGVLWFIFTKVFVNRAIPHYAVFLLCGLVPFNFFSVAWLTGTNSLVANAPLIKRVPVAREIVPIASVFSNALHLLIQIGLLVAAVFVAGLTPNRYWAWLPFVWGFEMVFACGLALMFSAVNVYVRDTQYVVESCNQILFWVVPIFYPFSSIPPQFRNLYQYNPVAALVLACRNIMLEGTAPPSSLLYKLAFSSTVVFLAGWWCFRRLQRRFYDYL